MLRSGDQAGERSGSAAFWGSRKSALFHKGDLDSAAPTRALPEPVRDAILDQDRVVGVVLNAIDDSLDKGKHGPAHWTVADVTHLRAVLDEARLASRPVILTADHGRPPHHRRGPHGSPEHPAPAPAVPQRLAGPGPRQTRPDPPTRAAQASLSLLFPGSCAVSPGYSTILAVPVRCQRRQ